MSDTSEQQAIAHDIFSHSEKETIKKLVDFVEKHDPSGLSIFDKREVATIKRMIATYEGFESIGRLGRSIRSILTLIGFFVIAYSVFKGWLADYLHNLLIPPSH